MEGNETLPDHLRCKRTDGRQWRCNRRVMEDNKLCEIHYIQGRHRQNKEKVPDSLKLERKKPNKKPQNLHSQLHNLEIRAKKIVKKSKKSKRKRCVSEALDEALKKMKLKRGDLQLELIRVFLKRQVEKKKEREFERDNERELRRKLPNGVLEISSSPSPNKFNNVGCYNVKLGLNSCSNLFSRRSFRSKNIERFPFDTMQAMPPAQSVGNLKKGKRKKCHCCRRSNQWGLTKCSSSQKHFFCRDCIGRYVDKQEVKMACPVCRGTCICRACSKKQSKDDEHEELYRDKNKVEKIQLLHYLICRLLPVLEQVNREQSIELDIEAKITGKMPSEVKIQQAELGWQTIICCNCKNSIVDFHRSCTNCSYTLCLSCCWEFCRGRLPGGIKAFQFKYPSTRKCGTSEGELLSEMKQTSISRKSSGRAHIVSPMLLQKWKACADGSISCPPGALGGCGDSLLDLRCVLPFSWTKELEVIAEEIVCSYDYPETSDASSCCSLCGGTDYKAGGIKLLQEVARRKNSNDNFLYCPTMKSLHEENLEHFQKHWGKGHPVIVRNVVQNSLDLSWDPLIMFCTYLEKSSAKSQSDKETVKATNCLDWCEVEIGMKQVFMGSLEGQTHANMKREMLKLKAWLSSHLFQEQFPAHYAEIMHSLPLQEYMNPISGILNLDVKLPQEMRRSDLGPCIYISYAGPDELMQADFVTKLCYESYDMVNILAHATDVPASTEQLTNIKKSIKSHKVQDNKESTTNITDQKITNDAKGKSSSQSEVTEESSLQDMVGEGLHLANGTAKVSVRSCDSLKNCALSAEDGNMSHSSDHDSEFDFEATIHCSGIIQSSGDSDDQNFDDDIESCSCSGENLVADSCGAQWDIFRRQDVPKLLEYLKRHSNEFSYTHCPPKHVVHPILDREFFLDAYHKLRLKQEFDIEPWTFEQHLGEAVIIPAGCPYQTRKLKSSVNVALDFISPENAAECINLNDELRLLPLRHKAKEKMFEVKKMSLYGVSAAIEEIRNLTHAELGRQ
ncbi:unnamed protein product [Ilex paraguariensis]|uniref:Lysine-specific demethylase JMJ25 n=1 Tax=Ilex paraguariensis TaxID=185542 RepID=A0ABC8UJY4_9AQUA